MTARATHWREDLIAALLGALVVAGLFLDGAHHLALAHGADESFFSPWHLPLFVGFNACAIWMITRNDRLRAMLTGARSSTPAAAAAGSRPALGTAHVALLGLALAALGTAGRPFGFLVIAGAAVVLAACVRAIIGPIAIDRRVGLAAACAFALTAGAFGAAGLNRRHTSSATPAAASATPAHDHHAAAATAAPAAAATRAAAKAKATSSEAASPARHAAASHHARATAAPRTVGAHRADTSSAATTTTTTTHHVARHDTTAARPVVRHRAPVVRHGAAPARPVPHHAPSRPAPDRITVTHQGSGFKPDTIPSVPSPSPAAVQTTTTTTTTPGDSSASNSTSSSPTSAPTPAPAPSSSTPVRKGGPGPG